MSRLKPPLRSYQELTTPKGDRIKMELGADHETLKALMREGAIEEVDIGNLAKRYCIPTSAVLALTWALNGMRVTCPADKPLDVDGTQAAFERYQAIFKQLLVNIADVEKDLSKLIDADPKRENLIRLKRGLSDIGVIKIDTDQLVTFRKEAAKIAAYFQRWRSEAFNSVTWHGDVAYLVQLIEQAARKEKVRVSFTNPGSNGVAFIEKVLIRAGVLRSSRQDYNRTAIAQIFNRRKKWKRKAFAKISGS